MQSHSSFSLGIIVDISISETYFKIVNKYEKYNSYNIETY